MFCWLYSVWLRFTRWFKRYLRAVYLLMTFSVAQNDSAPQPIPKLTSNTPATISTGIPWVVNSRSTSPVIKGDQTPVTPKFAPR
jgi:hypothetical protein